MTKTQDESGKKRPMAVVYNPAAGGGKARRRMWLIETALKANSLPYDLYVTESEAHLVETAETIIQRYPVVVGAGGDTTVNLIATQIMNLGTRNTLGVIGMGSVNDLARELGLYRLKDSLEAVDKGTTCDIDVGVLRSASRQEPYYFLVSASIGLGVAVNRYIDDWMRKYRVFLNIRSAAQQAVAMPGIHQAFKNKQVPLEVTLEVGGTSQNLLSSLLVFSNISSFAGMFRPSPTASPVNGSLDCCFFDFSSLAEVLQVSLDIRRQKHLEKNKVQIIRDKTFRIRSETPLEFQVDGAIIELGNDVEISILPKALTIFKGRRCAF